MSAHDRRMAERRKDPEFERFYQAAQRAIREAEERIANCHNEVSCPRCGAPVGMRCVSVRGYGGYVDGVPASSYTKHPHRERWTQVVPAR